MPSVLLTTVEDATDTSMTQEPEKKSAMIALLATVDLLLPTELRSALTPQLPPSLEDASEEEMDDVHGNTKNAQQDALSFDAPTLANVDLSLMPMVAQLAPAELPEIALLSPDALILTVDLMEDLF
jgi:hypothetical protein